MSAVKDRDLPRVQAMIETALSSAQDAVGRGDPITATTWLDTASKAYEVLAKITHVAALVHITNAQTGR